MKIFVINFVWKGNHWMTVWRRHIDRLYREDEEKYYSIDCIILEPCQLVR